MRDIDLKTSVFAVIVIVISVLLDLLYIPLSETLQSTFIENNPAMYFTIMDIFSLGFIILTFIVGSKWYSHQHKSLILHNKVPRFFGVFYVTQLIIALIIFLFGAIWVYYGPTVPRESFVSDLLFSLVRFSGNSDLFEAILIRRSDYQFQIMWWMFPEIIINSLQRILIPTFGMITVFAWQTLQYQGKVETYPDASE